MSVDDVAAFNEVMRARSESGGYPDRCLIYVHYALRYQSAKLSQMNPPTLDALQEIAAEAGFRYQSHVQKHVVPFIEILKTAWQYRAPGPEVQGNNLVIRGCIALAAMLTEPEADLDELEGSLRRYIDNNNDSLTEWLRGMDAERGAAPTG